MSEQEKLKTLDKIYSDITLFFNNLTEEQLNELAPMRYAYDGNGQKICQGRDGIISEAIQRYREKRHIQNISKEDEQP